MDAGERAEALEERRHGPALATVPDALSRLCVGVCAIVERSEATGIGLARLDALPEPRRVLLERRRRREIRVVARARWGNGVWFLSSSHRGPAGRRSVCRGGAVAFVQWGAKTRFRLQIA